MNQQFTHNEQSNSGLWRRVRPTLVVTGLILPAGLALNYALNIFLARVLSVDGYGLFAFGQSLGILVATAGSPGFSQSMPRLVVTYHARGEQNLLRGLVGSTLPLVCGVSALLALVLVGVGYLLPEHRAGLLWSAALVLPMAIDRWREGSTRGLHKIVSAILPYQVLLPLVMLSAVLLFNLHNTLAALVVYVVIFTVLELAALAHLRGMFSFLASARPVRKMGHWLRVSIPMGLITIGNLGMRRWDIVILAVFSGLSTAGPYAAAARTALLSSLVLRVVSLVSAPWLAELYQTDQIRRFRQMLFTCCLGATVCGLPLYLLLMFFPVEILSMFGPRYKEAALALQILATGQFINLMAGQFGLALNMSQYERANLILTMSAAIISLLALGTLSFLYGIVGAAIATAATLCIRNVSQLAVSLWLFGNRNQKRRKGNDNGQT